MLTPKQKETAIKLYEQGFSQKRISEILMLSYGQVSHFLTHLFGPKKPIETFTQEELDTIVQLYNKDLFIHDIAKQMGRRLPVIQYQITKLQRSGILPKRGTSFRIRKTYYK